VTIRRPSTPSSTSERPASGLPPRRRLRPLAVVLALLAVVLVAAGCRKDTTTIGAVRSSNGALISISGTHSGAGTMGVDLMLGPDRYNPCHEQWDAEAGTSYNDTFYGACADSFMGRTSYYRHAAYTPGGAEIAGGVLFGGGDWNQCRGQWWCPNQDTLLAHGWSDRATAWALEFYPSSPNEGGVRIEGGFPFTTADGRAWSGDLGAMRPVLAGQPGVFNLAGWVHGGPWPADRWEVQAFQMPPFTQVTSAFYPEQGFSLTRNVGNRLTSWPMLSGHYKLYVWDNHTGEHYIVYRDLGPGASVVITPGAPCFGLAGALDPNTEQRAC
jgi:hypothetical protein